MRRLGILPFEADRKGRNEAAASSSRGILDRNQGNLGAFRADRTYPYEASKEKENYLPGVA